MKRRLLRHPILVLLVLVLFFTGYHLHRHDHHEDEGAHCPLCLLKATGFTLAALFMLAFHAAIRLPVRSPESDPIILPLSFPCRTRAPPCVLPAA